MRINFQTHRRAPVFSMAAASTALLSLGIGSAFADDVTLPPISVGAGVRTSFTHTKVDGVSDKVDDFALDSVRLYLSGSVMEHIGLTFNTEYNSSDEKVVVMDAIARFEFSDTLNIWAGRFLPPSDRANLYGPYYANHWGVYQDGVQDGYPSESVGRDDGVAYWGQFGMVKVSAGAFDVNSLTGGKSDVIYAGRVMVDFWDPEAGYFLNSTYYGEKDLLAVGVAGQSSNGDKAYSADFLLEKKIPGAGVVTVEAEYAKYDGLGGYDSNYTTDKGYYVLASYLFPQVVGIGKFQLLGKYGEAKFEDGANPLVNPEYKQKTTEVDVNYIIKSFNARVSLFYKDFKFDAVKSDFSQVGLGVQLQL